MPVARNTNVTIPTIVTTMPKYTNEEQSPVQLTAATNKRTKKNTARSKKWIPRTIKIMEHTPLQQNRAKPPSIRGYILKIVSIR